jgi:hypothetical protein
LLDDAEEQQLPGAMTDEFFMYKYKILGWVSARDSLSTGVGLWLNHDISY